MLLNYEGYANEDDYICDYPTMFNVYFNKKRLVKAMNYLGISNWKEFLQNEYASDDTQEIMSYFDEHGLQNDFYGEGNSAEDQITTSELEEIFQVLERTYATDEFLEQLSAKHDSIVWLVAFEKCANKWQALFYNEALDEIWTDL